MQNMSLKCTAVKICNFKKRWTGAIWKIKISQHHILTQNGSLGLIGRPPSWIFITKNLTNSKSAETTGSFHVVCFIPLRGKTFFVLRSLYETL